jgi:integrase
MASRKPNIRQRGKSGVVYFRANGKQHWRSFKTRDDAELYLAQSTVKKVRGDFRERRRMLFRDFAEEWLRDYAAGNVRPSTYDGYESVLRIHLLPEFGDLYLTEITRKMIDAFVSDWTRGGPRFQARVRLARERAQERARELRRKPRPVRIGRSPKTISNALVPLREMLGHAVEWDDLTSNPAERVKRPRREHREMQFLNADEIRLLLGKADKEWRTFFLCACTTGMRLGELLALRWGDVNWPAGRIWVRRSVNRRGQFQEPKSARSVRAVAMPPTLASALRHHRMASRFKGEDELIFANKDGRPLDGINLTRRAFKPMVRRAGLPAIRFHDLRHSFAALLIAQGEHPKLIQEQLGHASITVTLDRYGHLLDQSVGDASNRLEAVLFGGSQVAAAKAR